MDEHNIQPIQDLNEAIIEETGVLYENSENNKVSVS